MHKNNFYIFFGVWVAILPFTGIPGVWKNGLIFASGIFLMLTVVGPIILKDLTKTKPIKKKQKITTEPEEDILQNTNIEQKVEITKEVVDSEVHNKNL